MENRELGTLLVQPVKALNFSLTATVDTVSYTHLHAFTYLDFGDR